MKDYTGTICNGYKILSCVRYGTDKTPALYKAQCIKCGFVSEAVTIFELKQRRNDCIHSDRQAKGLPQHTGYINVSINGYTILECIDESKSPPIYKCQCNDCGFTIQTRLSYLRNRHDTNPCSHKLVISGWHWYSRKLQQSYHNMLYRCNDYYTYKKKAYIDKNIKVCSQWQEDPKAYQDWALANGYEDGLSLDRIDSTKDYSPNNCRWVTPHDNYSKTSVAKLYTINGITDTGNGWQKRLNLNHNWVYYRYKKYGYEQTLKMLTVEAARLEAEGIAAANERVRASLSPDLIQQHAIEKWNGVLPQVSGNGAMMFNIPLENKK